MALHGNTAYPLALSMGMSEVNEFFDSKAFGNYKKTQESRQKVSVTLITQFNSVLGAMGGLGKLLAGRRR